MTYCGSVAQEDDVVDLHIGPIRGINSATLQVVCPPPITEIRREKSGKVPRIAPEQHDD
jgi:hypothetical protein